MVRVILAGVLSGLAVFVWGVLSWLVLPLHVNALQNLPHPQGAAEAFLGALPEAGAYHYPGMPTGVDGGPPTNEQMNAAFERMRNGPHVALMIVHPDGAEPMPARNFILGFVLNVLAGLLVATLLACHVERLRTFGQRFLFVCTFGAFVLAFHYLHQWLWWGLPLDFALATIVDIVVGTVLIAVIVAALVRPRPALTTEP